jgi:HEPN domain-containing protein
MWQSLSDLLASSNHLFDSPLNYGLSKWASLQAAEKFIKDFIVAKGGAAPKHHNLKQLAAIAESHGLHKILENWLDDIQCSAEVRYGGISVTVQEAIEAQYATLQVCEHIAGEF